MSARGRGGRGGRGQSKSFTKEQLNTIGATPNEVPAIVTQPPALYPILNKRPVPLTHSLEMDYLLILRQDFIDHMELSGAYLKMPENKNIQPEQEIDKLVAQITGTKETFDWNLFPVELRPKMIAKRRKEKNSSNEVNIEKRLNLLEKLEEKLDQTEVVKKEVDEENEDVDIEDQDEEMDDGTDYSTNYYENSDDYEDEDDNLEEDPIY